MSTNEIKQDEIIAETITAHDQMLKRLWCIAYEEGQKAEREACAKVCDTEDVHRGNWYAAAIRARG